MGIIQDMANKVVNYFLIDSYNNGIFKAEAQKKLELVSAVEEREYAESMYGQLQLILSEIIFIEEVFPDKGKSLREQVELITKIIEMKNKEDDPEVLKAYKSFEKEYEESKRLAEGEYTILALQEKNAELDNLFDRCLETDDIIDKLHEYIEYMASIQEKVNNAEQVDKKPIFVGVQRQKFNEVSLSAEYRLKMLELVFAIRNNDIDDVTINPFENLSEIKQKRFSAFFYRDALQVEALYEQITKEESLLADIGESTEEIDLLADELNIQYDKSRVIKDISISKLFDSNEQSLESFEFLKKFIAFKLKCKQLEKKIEICREHKKEILEINQLTDKQIEDEIYRIGHDMSLSGNRCLMILDYQTDIARKRGLIKTEERFKSNNLTCCLVDTISLYNITHTANQMNMRYIIFPDSQDGSGKEFKIYMDHDDYKKICEIIEDFPDIISFSNNNDYKYKKFLGSVPIRFIETVKKILNNDRHGIKEKIYAEREGDIYKFIYASNHTYSFAFQGAQKIFKTVNEKLDSLAESKKVIENMLCYFSVPVERNFISILHKLNDSNIPVYLEKEDMEERNQKGREFVHIYFEKNDLERIKEMFGHDYNIKDNNNCLSKRMRKELNERSAKCL